MVLIPAFVLLTSPQPSLAFVARFYKSGSAKSHFELYVSDLSGGNRKMLKTAEEPRAVQWVGHDRLLWVSENALWTSKLSPWKPVLVKKTTTLHFGESRYRDTEPGMPELVEDFDRAKGVFILDPNTLKLEQAVNSPHHQDISIPDSGEIMIKDPNNEDNFHPVKVTRYDGFEYWLNGKPEKSDWGVFRAWYSDNASRLWLSIGSHTSTSGDINGIMLFEKGKKPRMIFENANCVDFWTARGTYAYCTPRDTSTLGKKDVWTSELHVGDWKKGTDRTILKGLVWVPSVSIRP